MPIYRVVTTIGPAGVQPIEIIQVVSAPNQAQAIRYVAKGIINAEVIEMPEAMMLAAKGVKLEHANGAA